jgi:lactate dehydrogenase-like 2-hydroxyacid dehydrogenase
MKKFKSQLNKFENVKYLLPSASLEGNDLTEIDAWITNPAPRETISKDLVNSLLPKLKRISSPSTGTTHIDADILKSDKIVVKCLRDVSHLRLAQISSSSEHTFFLFLSLLRKAKRCFAADLVSWRDDLDIYRGWQVKGIDVLIFGFGRIGSNLAKYFDAFGANVNIYEPDLTKHDSRFKFIEEVNLKRSVSEVDAVFLCFHWTPENNEFFDAQFLNVMRWDSFLVNSSRGENLDEGKLCDLLKKGKFRGVALDVIKDEQLGLFDHREIVRLANSLPNLIITPHIAGASYDSEKIAFNFALELVQVE